MLDGFLILFFFQFRSFCSPLAVVLVIDFVTLPCAVSLKVMEIPELYLSISPVAAIISTISSHTIQLYCPVLFSTVLRQITEVNANLFYFSFFPQTTCKSAILFNCSQQSHGSITQAFVVSHLILLLYMLAPKSIVM